MTTALITGASGFIGGHLAEALIRRGVHVRCLVRRPETCVQLEQAGAELFCGDVTQPASLHTAMQGVDVVYHLAALTSAFRFTDLLQVNEQGTGNVARACAAQPNPPVHIYVSSIAAAGPIDRGQVRTEADRPNPVSNYGRTKRAGELAAEEFAHLVPTTVIRPGIVFGERNREMLPMFSTIERFRIHPQPGFSPPPLSLIYVNDLIDMLISAAARGQRIPAENACVESTSQTTGQGYYFACVEEYPTYSELGQMLARALGRQRVLVVPLAGPLPWVAASVNEIMSRVRGSSDTFNIDKIREATVSSWACSPAAAKADLGFAPSATLEEQFAATAEWYRDNDWIGERPVISALKKAASVFFPLTPISPTFSPQHPVESSTR